jgi:hypothetical protein
MTITSLLELTLKADSLADAPRILTKTLEATRGSRAIRASRSCTTSRTQPTWSSSSGGPPSLTTTPTAPGERRPKERLIWAPCSPSDRG